MGATAVRRAAAILATIFFLGPSISVGWPEGAGTPPGRAGGGLTRHAHGPKGPEKQMFDLVNRDRADPANARETRGRARPLRWNPKLEAVARAHSRDMIARRYFAHTDPGGVTPAMRVTEAGIPWQAQGENIAEHYGVEQAERAFMDEPPFQHNHRGNILNARFTEIGIGVVRGTNGLYYITQEFVGNPSGPSNPWLVTAPAGHAVRSKNGSAGR